LRRTCGEFSGDREGKDVKDLSSSFVGIDVGFEEPEPLFLDRARTVLIFPLVVEVVEVCDKDRCGNRGCPSSSMVEWRGQVREEGKYGRILPSLMIFSQDRVDALSADRCS